MSRSPLHSIVPQPSHRSQHPRSHEPRRQRSGRGVGGADRSIRHGQRNLDLRVPQQREREHLSRRLDRDCAQRRVYRGTGSSQGATPAQLQPGEAGLSYIYFDNAEAIPADAEYEFRVSRSDADTSPYNTAPLTVTEANVSGDSIVGSATNETGAETTGPYSVLVYCLEGDILLSSMVTFPEQVEEIPEGGTVMFSASLFGGSCPTFALGVSGYFS